MSTLAKPGGFFFRSLLRVAFTEKMLVMDANVGETGPTTWLKTLTSIAFSFLLTVGYAGWGASVRGGPVFARINVSAS